MHFRLFLFIFATIKDYDSESEIYTLSIPNQEVRVGYTKGLMPAYVGLEPMEVQTSSSPC